MRTKIAASALAVVCAFGLAACDGNAEDDLENIEENVEEGVSEVGEAVEEGGEEMQDGADDEG